MISLIISISREHGTNGKEIGRLVASKLNIPFYDKEEMKEFAIKNNMIDTNYSEEEIYDNFLYSKNCFIFVLAHGDQRINNILSKT